MGSRGRSVEMLIGCGIFIIMNINKLLRSVVLAGIFAVPFIPLIVSSSMYFPFITGKNFAFRVIVGVIFGLWLYLAYKEPTYRPKKSWLLYSAAAYLGVMILATAFGVNSVRSFWSNFERMEGLVTYLHLFAYFLVISTVLNSKKLWFWFLNTSVLASVIISIYGFVQLAGKAAIHQSGTRLDATLGNSAYLAVYILFHIFLLAYLCVVAQRENNRFLKYLYAILGVAEAVILYFTATRGAILGLLGGVGLIVLLLAWRGRGSVRKWSLGAVAVMIVLVGLFIGIKDTAFVKESPVLSRFGEISLSSGTSMSRLLIWNMSWQGFKERPILGWGPENYGVVFAKFYDPKMWGQEPWFDRSHNVFFDNLINGGLLGLVAYLALFGFTLYYIWRRKEGDESNDLLGKSILTGLLAGYFFQNIFVFDNLVSSILFYSVIGYVQAVWAGAIGETPVFQNKTEKEEDAYGTLVAIGAVGVIILSVYYFSWRGITVSQTLIKAISSQTAEPAVQNFEKIFAYNNVVGLTEAREQLISRAPGILGSANVANETKQAYFTLINEQMVKHFAGADNDTRMHLFYGSLLRAMGSNDLAIAQLERARELSPQKQGVLFELGSTYLAKGDKVKAREVLKLAYEEEPNYPEAKKIYALVLLLTGDNVAAEKLLAGKDRLEIISDDRFINVYNQIGRKDIVAEINNYRASKK